MVSDEALAEIERVGREFPDGVHTCAELQRLEPGRRPCTCGGCPPAEIDVVAEAVPAILEGLLASMMHTVRICGRCWSDHFQPQPSLPHRDCLVVKCECWCTTRRDQ